MTSLSEVLSEEGVSEARISALTGQGWTLSSFATVVPSLADFDGIWDELLPGDSLNLLEKDQIRAAWKRVSEKQSASSSSGPQPGPTAGWSEPFVPGFEKPLSAAVLLKHHPVLSIDILLDSSMDILNDAFFEDLLRLCSCGVVAYVAASPSC